MQLLKQTLVCEIKLQNQRDSDYSYVFSKEWAAAMEQCVEDIVMKKVSKMVKKMNVKENYSSVKWHEIEQEY